MMWFSSWLRTWTRSDSAPRRRSHGSARQRAAIRPRLEALEDRTLLTAYAASSVSDLVADINAANKVGGTNTITLAANTTFGLTAVNNTTNGPNGLPVIQQGDNLTIAGNGDTIEVSPGSSGFRLIDVASGGSMTLQDLTLANGLASKGGAILNQGTLTLSGVALQNNEALGLNGASNVSKTSKTSNPVGQDAAGGAIWSSGAVTLQDLILSNGAILHTVLQDNHAIGGNGGSFYSGKILQGGNAGNALGAGLYLAGGTASLTNAILANNAAYGGNGGTVLTSGNGGTGGGAFGGAMEVAGGTATLNDVVLQSNTASGGQGGFSGSLVNSTQGAGGIGSGGAVNVTTGSVSLTASVLQNNVAQGGVGGNDASADTFAAPGDGVGGNAYGGALAMSGGSVMLNGDTLQGNQAISGSGVPAGNAYGGAIAVSGGSVTLRGDTVQDNSAVAVPSAVSNISSSALGGGIYIASPAIAYLDSVTVANALNNDADRFDGSIWQDDTSNIDGPYVLQN